jgi:nitroreductase
LRSEELIEFLKTRRSIRKFKQQSVSRDILEKILDTARYAPSARNSQPWVFIVVEDPSIKESLSRIHQWAWPLANAPLGVAVACNKDLSPDSYLLDCSNATMYIMLSAHAYGLGTVWIQTMRDNDKIREILGLSSNYVVVSLLAMGYPDEHPAPKPRKPLSNIVFYNRFEAKK